ncbi:hypothetical protein PENFLA_c075G04643 [Penicillium flavigenum]|uniref:Uncharacterized protein n=1 Tax=Penicillium flavigenum TaxID=254877 RepID=A0A1V6SBY0_9EURO|nr:hypothetical protein PENFLA_c075G04643 [Penicillium flavigenum]
MTLMHRDSGYGTADGADPGILADGFNEQPGSNFGLATSEARVNEHWPYGGGEKFRYQSILKGGRFRNVLYKSPE